MNFDYPAPKVCPRFNFYWDRYINNVVERDNFKMEHLDQLSILCQMYVDIEEIEDDLKTEGRTYTVTVKTGYQIKCHPLVGQLNTLRAEVRNYNRQLGLVLGKDKQLKDSTSKNEWLDEEN